MLSLFACREDKADTLIFTQDAALRKKATLPLVVDADLLGKPLADADGAIKLDLEKLTNILDADVSDPLYHSRLSEVFES